MRGGPGVPGGCGVKSLETRESVPFAGEISAVMYQTKSEIRC
jgi:hypothetical protein